jgi:hypothetical protein
VSHLLRRKPSAPLAISIAALVFAMSGTAIAASNLVRGDSLIRKHSLSGNRLRNHTLTGNQINLAKLGTVPSAQRAVSATHATSADTALSAGDATTLGGKSVRWLLANPSGTIVSQSGGFSISRSGGPGYYLVDAGSAVSGHAVIISSGVANDLGFRGSPAGGPCGTGPDSFDCSALAPGANDGHHIVVITFAPSNTAVQDHSFYLLVY